MQIEKIIHASALALIDEGKVMLCSRPEGKDYAGMFEFPGGKVESGEMPSDALVREIKEELDIIIKQKDLIPVAFTEYTYKDKFRVVLYLFACKSYEGELAMLEGQDYSWFNISELENVEKLLLADMVFIKPLQSFEK